MSMSIPKPPATFREAITPLAAVAAGIFFVFLVGAIFVIIRVTPSPPDPPPAPPLEYSEKYYAPNQLVYVPGETVHYTPTLTYRDWGLARFTRTFWRRDNGLPGGSPARLCDGLTDAPSHEFSRILPFETVGIYRDGNTGEPVPEMPPGQYWLLGEVENSAGGKAQYQVPFVIAKPCPDDT